MKIKKVISKRAYNRFKFMCASGLGLLALTYVNEQYVGGAIDQFFMSPADDMGGIFVNAAEEENLEDTKVILDYTTGDEKTVKDHVIGDVAVAGTYKYKGEEYGNRIVQTRSLGYVVEFYKDQ